MIVSKGVLLVLIIAAFNGQFLNAFYLPGLAPQSFCTEAKAKEVKSCKVIFIAFNSNNHKSKHFVHLVNRKCIR